MKVGGVALDVNIDDESIYESLSQKPESLDQIVDSMDENEDTMYPN